MAKVTSSKIPIILGAAGGVVGVAGIVVGVLLGTRQPSSGFKLTLETGEYGTIDGEHTKILENQTMIQTAYSVQADADHEFAGWYQDEAKTQAIEYPFTLNQDTTFYADYNVFSPTTFTVTYDTGGGTPIDKTTVLKGKAISRPDTSRDNYELLKWYEKDTGDEVFKLKGSTYDVYTPNRDVTLCASWKQISFTLLFDANGGIVPGAIHEESGDIYKLENVEELKTPPLAKKSGSTFVGWFTDKGCTTSAVFPYRPKKDEETLFAKWETTTTTYTITLNPDGGTIIGGECEYNVNLLPYQPTAEKVKYQLEGWCEEVVSDTMVTFPYEPKGNVTLIAKWKQIGFDAKVYHNSDKTKVYEGASFTNIKLFRYADIPTVEDGDVDVSEKTGSAADYHNYTIAKWIFKMGEHQEEEKTPGNVVVNTLDGDIEMYAVWEHTKFDITLHRSTEAGSETTKLEHQTSLTSAPSVPSSWIGAHSQFTGWTDVNGNPIDYTYEKLNSDMDLYMSEKVAMGKVYLHVDTNPKGATYNGTEDWYYTEEYSSLGSGFNKRGQPEVAYKEALGWARVDTSLDNPETWEEPTEEDIVKDNKWPVRPEPNKIAHLYPLYRDTHYKLTFETNGGSEVADRMVKANEVVPTVDIPTTVKGGSQFLGWCTDDECTKDMDWSKEIDGNKTLYAKFKEVAWKITYHYRYLNQDKTFVTDDWYKVIPTYEAAGGTETPENPTGDVNYPFIGWSKTQGQNYPDKDLIGQTMDGNIDLYAVFPDASTTCTVTIQPNGASWSSGSTNPKTFAAYKNYQPLTGIDDVTKRVNDTLSKTDSSLAGWAADDGGSYIGYDYDLFEHGTLVDPNDETKGRKIALYASWKDMSTYLVTFDASPGYFKYYDKSTLSITTTKSYVYTVNEKSEAIGTNPTFEKVYKQFLKDLSQDGVISVTGPTRDGFSLDISEGVGWLRNGEKVQSSTYMRDIAASTLNANYKENQPTSWWDDDWYTFANIAEGGEEAILNVAGYKEAYQGTKADKTGTHSKAANTFVGLERPLIMSDYSVTKLRTRVIGVGQDNISKTSKALFSFDFIDCPIQSAYATSGNYYLDSSSFHNSSIRTLLQSALPDGIKQNMKSVIKYAIMTDDDSYDNCQAHSFKSELFLPSAYEINGGTTSKNLVDYNGSAYIEKDLIENTSTMTNLFVYQYYSGHQSSDIGSYNSETKVFSNEYRFKYVINAAGGEDLVSWWTRTPAQHAGGYFPEGGAEKFASAFYVTTNEHSSYPNKPYSGGLWMYNANQARGISPVFCLGLVV